MTNEEFKSMVRESNTNRLHPKDEELFSKMENNYISENERIFFETQKYKQIYVVTCLNDLVINEYDNDDHIYLVRIAFDEYELGHGIDNMYDENFHTMCLAEVLEANLKHLGYIDRDITLFEWLRERDYEGVLYNNNFDDLQ